jgi:hypothetical protein
MTKAELIEALKDFPDDMEIICGTPALSIYDVKGVVSEGTIIDSTHHIKEIMNEISDKGSTGIFGRFIVLEIY